MAAQDTEQEPSIEEILSSIRQIISDDDEDAPAAPAPAAAAPPPSAPEPEPESFEEALELTNKIEDGPVMDESPEPEEPPIEVAMQEAVEDVLEEAVEEEFMAEPEPEPVAPAPAPKPRPAPVEDTDSILTSRAESAAMSGFAELARKTAVEYNGITLEEIVRTELKPMLREWLDKNLPSIIERLVAEELERVAKRALED